MKIKKALICGAGLMGKNIAFLLTKKADLEVIVYDINNQDIKKSIKEGLVDFIEENIISEEDVESRINNIQFTTDLNDPLIKDVDIVIEAIYENMDAKQKLFNSLEEILDQKTIFCTNSSVMSPTEISKDLTFKNRFLGTHFWNPPHIIPLVEIVKTNYTSEEFVKVVYDLLKNIGKIPVICNKDVPGFIANRMQHALWREAISIINEGICDAETVDMAVKNSFGLRLPQLGPIENADMVGLDLTLQIHDYILQYLDNSGKPSQILIDKNNENKLGFKTEEGFYKWNSESISKVRSGLNKYLIKIIKNK